MSSVQKPILISIKPDYADLVFRGLKTAELRKRVSKDMQHRDVFVYVSSPVMELRGGFRVGQVWSGTPEQIWKTVSGLAAVSEETFFDYYEGSKIAVALEIAEVWQYRHPISLNRLREKFSDFVVPQSYRYATGKECQVFRSLAKKLSLEEDALRA